MRMTAGPPLSLSSRSLALAWIPQVPRARPRPPPTAARALSLPDAQEALT